MLEEGWWAYTAAPIAFLAALVLTPLVIRLAHRQGWLARPRADRWHERPTALMGGIAIYAATTLAFVLAGGNGEMWFVWGGATLMFVTGLADDLRDISPAAKLLAQVAATMLLLYAGYAFGQGGPFWLTIPLTFLWVIGVTNAVNLLDNMDGLAAGVATIAALALAVFAGFTIGAEGAAAAALAVAGGAGGFLVYNFKPARIFMGDCGSLFLGYVVAAFAVVVQGQVGGRGGLAIYLVSVAVLAVPIFDTTLVTFARILSGRPVSQGGQDHSSHRLVRLGLSERWAVLTLYAVSLVAGALALAFHFSEVTLFYALATFFVVGLAVFGVQLGRTNVYAEATPVRQSPPMYKGIALARSLMGRHWKVVLGLVADLLLVAAAFVLAHYLRFENGLSPQRETMLMYMLPAVIGLKLLVFAGAGLYRGIWRHAGTPEGVRILGATTLGSALAYVALAAYYGPAVLSEAAFFIDWMIVTLVVGGARFGFRTLRHYFAAQRREGRRVVLYDTSSAGQLTLRMLRQNADLGLAPIGFLDDDPHKRGLVAQGLPVLGTFQNLEGVCRDHQVEEVLITHRLSEDRQEVVMHHCRDAGVACRVFDLSLRPIQPEEEDPPLVLAEY